MFYINNIYTFVYTNLQAKKVEWVNFLWLIFGQTLSKHISKNGCQYWTFVQWLYFLSDKIIHVFTCIFSSHHFITFKVYTCIWNLNKYWKKDTGIYFFLCNLFMWKYMFHSSTLHIINVYIKKIALLEVITVKMDDC
jgi:hypothetical protein